MVVITKDEWTMIKETKFIGKSLRIFLSYSSDDKILAGKIKNYLEQFQISVFLAHEDIEPTLEWRGEILHNLNDCDVFLPLLTQNFIKSEWTNQEVGIAFGNDKIIISLIVNIRPFGFLEKDQGLRISEELSEFSYKDIIKTISKNNILKENLKNCIILSLEKARNYDSGEKRLELLENLDFTEVQITEIFRKAVINNQIRCSRKGVTQLGKWLEAYSSKIDPSVKELFEKVQNEFTFSVSDD